MLSPEALLLESLAVSALTLSVCSQFINSTEQPPSPTAEGSRMGLGWEPRTSPRLRAHSRASLVSEAVRVLRAARISEGVGVWR